MSAWTARTPQPLPATASPQPTQVDSPAGSLDTMLSSDNPAWVGPDGTQSKAAEIVRSLRASMGAVGNCYDNIFAERLINTLKNEYWLSDRFVDLEQIERMVAQVVGLYNTDRPHLALGMAVPEQVFRGSIQNVKEIVIPAAEEIPSDC